MPFDTKTPAGYLVSYGFQTGAFYVILQMVSTALELLFGCFMTAICVGKEIQRRIHNLNELYQVDRNDAKFRDNFYYIMKHHSDIKELSATVLLQ